MNVIRDEQGAKVELVSAAANRFVEIAQGLTFGYDRNGKVVAIAFTSEPWTEIREIARLGFGPAVASLTYDPEADAMALESLATTYDESEEVEPGVIVEFDVNGKVRGVEVIAVNEIFSKAAIEKLREFTITEQDVAPFAAPISA